MSDEPAEPTLVLECDHCTTVEVFLSVLNASRAGWQIITGHPAARPAPTLRVICPRCREER